MPDVVFDTVLFVRALINPNGPGGRLMFERAGEYRMVISMPMLVEIPEVLTRSELSRKYRGLATRNLQATLAILAQANVVEVTTIPPVCRDPNDDKILATAVAAGADYIVSEDKDLLSLGSHEGVQIVTTASFLALLEAREYSET
jgi:putative PIN family toxin of toxin-antitoxin system